MSALEVAARAHQQREQDRAEERARRDTERAEREHKLNVAAQQWLYDTSTICDWFPSTSWLIARRGADGHGPVAVKPDDQDWPEDWAIQVEPYGATARVALIRWDADLPRVGARAYVIATLTGPADLGQAMHDRATAALAVEG